MKLYVYVRVKSGHYENGKFIKGDMSLLDKVFGQFLPDRFIGEEIKIQYDGRTPSEEDGLYYPTYGVYTP